MREQKEYTNRELAVMIITDTLPHRILEEMKIGGLELEGKTWVDILADNFAEALDMAYGKGSADA